MNLQIGLLLGISSLIFIGLGNAISKAPIKKFGPNRLMLWRGLMMAGILLLVVLATGQFVNFSLKYTLITIVISFIGYWPLYFFYKGMGLGKIGIISPVSSIYTIFTTFLAMVVYKERLSSLEMMAIAIIVIGVFLISISFRDFKNSHLFQKSSGIYYALLAAVGWGIYFFLIKIPVIQMGSILTSFLEETIMLVIVLVIMAITREKITKPVYKDLKPVIAISVLSVLGVLSYYQGIKIYSLSIMTALAAAVPLIVCLYGWLVYNEKLTPKQYVAIRLIIFGIVLISLK